MMAFSPTFSAVAFPRAVTPPQFQGANFTHKQIGKLMKVLKATKRPTQNGGHENWQLPNGQLISLSGKGYIAHNIHIKLKREIGRLLYPHRSEPLTSNELANLIRNPEPARRLVEAQGY